MGSLKARSLLGADRGRAEGMACTNAVSPRAWSLGGAMSSSVRLEHRIGTCVGGEGEGLREVGGSQTAKRSTK